MSVRRMNDGNRLWLLQDYINYRCTPREHHVFDFLGVPILLVFGNLSLDLPGSLV